MARLSYQEVLREELRTQFADVEDPRINEGIDAALKRARKRTIEMFDCAHCGEPCHDQYMVHNDVWRAAMPTSRGLLHLRCLEAKLGRPVRLDDLSKAIINDDIRYFVSHMGLELAAVKDALSGLEEARVTQRERAAKAEAEVERLRAIK